MVSDSSVYFRVEMQCTYNIYGEISTIDSSLVKCVRNQFRLLVAVAERFVLVSVLQTVGVVGVLA